jgi:hypothetical protein
MRALGIDPVIHDGEGMRALGINPSVVLSVRIDPDMLAAVRERARKEHRPVSALVREAIYFYLTGR